MKTVAIHQPNFLPWLGYFHKIVHSDVFVLLDSVQFIKTGGNWTNRMKLFVSADKTDFVTVPIVRNYHGLLPISGIQVNPDQWDFWKNKFFRSLQCCYGKAPYFAPVMDFLEGCFSRRPEFLADFNIACIRAILEYLDLKRDHLVRSGELDCAAHSTELLIEITRKTSCDTYMCGGGASGYQEDVLFEQAGIGLKYQNFHHPQYPQGRKVEFVPGLSILDAMFNLSVGDCAKLLSGYEPTSDDGEVR